MKTNHTTKTGKKLQNLNIFSFFIIYLITKWQPIKCIYINKVYTKNILKTSTTPIPMQFL